MHRIYNLYPTSLHEEVRELLGSQLHGSQPFPLAKFQWLGPQWSHVKPMTFGRHWHCPVERWQTQSSLWTHWLLSVPRRLQVHSREKNCLKNVNNIDIMFKLDTLDTHFCSSVWRRPHSNHSCRCHSWGLQCCTSTSCTFLFAYHRPPCQTDLCCCCTGMAGSGLRAEKGSRNNQGHNPHNENLCVQRKPRKVFRFQH